MKHTSKEAALLRINKALGMKLSVRQYDGAIIGSSTAVVAMTIGAPLGLDIEVIDSFDIAGLGVILHLHGNLYMLVYCLHSNGVVSTYLINGNGLSTHRILTLTKRAVSLRDFVSQIRKSIVASFYWSGTSWAKITLPS